jgi:cell division protein FtsI (penicillin-binding protein 3)
VAVTPLQLAMAYAAIANGGVLLTPALVKSVQNPDGETVYEHRPRSVRRVLQASTSRTLRDILASVVDSGTATDAALTAYAFGGKSGTARRLANGRYGTGRYTSTFVGLFPAREPQYVVLVKIDNPQGSYYGGMTAGPVAKAVVEAAIAARDAGLDRGDLALQKARYVPPAERSPMGRVASAGAVAAAGTAEPEPAPRYALVDSMTEVPPAPPARFDLRKKVKAPSPNREAVAVPDVRRLPVRVAVRELHRAGLRVRLLGDAGAELAPPPGTVVPRGTLVRLGRQ